VESEQEKYNSLKNPAPALELVTAWALKRTEVRAPLMKKILPFSRLCDLCG
jgi:hypothetical protein